MSPSEITFTANRAQTRVGAESPHGRARDEHQTLHGLLVMLFREAASAVDKNAGRRRVGMALTALREALLLHHDYEERELVPVLGARGTLESRIAKEHAAQRATLSALLEDAGDEGGARSMGELAEEVFWFGRGLERDMKREESELLDCSSRVG